MPAPAERHVNRVATAVSGRAAEKNVVMLSASYALRPATSQRRCVMKRPLFDNRLLGIRPYRSLC